MQNTLDFVFGNILRIQSKIVHLYVTNKFGICNRVGLNKGGNVWITTQIFFNPD